MRGSLTTLCRLSTVDINIRQQESHFMHVQHHTFLIDRINHSMGCGVEIHVIILVIVRWGSRKSKLLLLFSIWTNRLQLSHSFNFNARTLLKMATCQGINSLDFDLMLFACHPRTISNMDLAGGNPLDDHSCIFFAGI